MHSSWQIAVDAAADGVHAVTLSGMAQAGRNAKLVQLRVRRGLTQAQLAELVTDAVRATGPRWRNATLGGEFISRLETGRITWPNSVYRTALVCGRGSTTRAAIPGRRHGG